MAASGATVAGKGLTLFAREDVFMPARAIGMKAISQHGESIVIYIVIILSRTTSIGVKEAIQAASRKMSRNAW
jgi:hypothetical protein